VILKSCCKDSTSILFYPITNEQPRFSKIFYIFPHIAIHVKNGRCQAHPLFVRGFVGEQFFFFYNKGLLLFHRKANPDLVSRAGRDIRTRRFMRNYYASDKKKREESKRRQKEEKRLKKLNKNSKNTIQSATEPTSNSAATESDSSAQGS